MTQRKYFRLKLQQGGDGVDITLSPKFGKAIREEVHVQNVSIRNTVNAGIEVDLDVSDGSSVYPHYTFLNVPANQTVIYPGEEIVLQGDDVLEIVLRDTNADDLFIVVISGYRWNTK